MFDTAFPEFLSGGGHRDTHAISIVLKVLLLGLISFLPCLVLVTVIMTGQILFGAILARSILVHLSSPWLSSWPGTVIPWAQVMMNAATRISRATMNSSTAI
jgi:hypothetical protein